MKYVIDIPDVTKKVFDNADNTYFSFYDYNSVIGKAIRNATPLEEYCDSCPYQPTESEDD